jgi:hypothetical protein
MAYLRRGSTARRSVPEGYQVSFFFILGLPRSQTAWLSVMLTGPNSFCFHEGTGRFATWDEYVSALRGRPEAFVGDSNPALFENIDELIEEFPDARFLVVTRPQDQALAAFCAAVPHESEAIRQGWNDYVRRFTEAIARLPEHLTVTVKSLDHEETAQQIYAHLVNGQLDVDRWRMLRDLRITSTFPPVQSRPEALEVSVNVDGFDFSGLSVRHYSPEDRQMLDEWWKYHKEAPMHAIRLPPLGIIVEDAEGPAAALWCYETFGVGVAWLAVPVTRPKLGYARASTVLAFAILAMTQVAGKGHIPEGKYTCFRVIGTRGMGRLLERLGFTHQSDRTNYFLSI